MENSLPEWVTWVATGIGIVFATVAAKMGLTSNPGSTSTAEVAGALIDSKAAKEITEALSTSTRQYVDCHEEAMEFEKERSFKSDAQFREFTEEIRELRKELRELGREIAHARSRPT